MSPSKHQNEVIKKIDKSVLGKLTEKEEKELDRELKQASHWKKLKK